MHLVWKARRHRRPARRIRRGCWLPSESPNPSGNGEIIDIYWRVRTWKLNAARAEIDEGSIITISKGNESYTFGETWMTLGLVPISSLSLMTIRRTVFICQVVYTIPDIESIDTCSVHVQGRRFLGIKFVVKVETFRRLFAGEDLAEFVCKNIVTPIITCMSGNGGEYSQINVH